MIVDHQTWLKAQKQELIFWTNQNYHIIQEYKDNYSLFDDYIANIDKSKDKILDIGCGAIAYTPLFNFKNLVLYDSLMDDYINLDKNKTNIFLTDCVRLSGISEELPFDDNSFDNIFCLNMLDQVQIPTKSLYEISRVLNKNGKLFFSCDLRDKTDECHPHEISQMYLDWLIGLCKLKVLKSRIISKQHAFDIYQAILIKEE